MPSLDVLAAIDNMFGGDPVLIWTTNTSIHGCWRDLSSGRQYRFQQAGDIRVKPVLGPAGRAAGETPKPIRSGVPLRRVSSSGLKRSFVRYLPEVKQAGLLESAYLEGAEKDAKGKTLTGRPEKWRRVAHIVHLGRFMGTGAFRCSEPGPGAATPRPSAHPSRPAHFALASWPHRRRTMAGDDHPGKSPRGPRRNVHSLSAPRPACARPCAGR